MPKKTSGGLKIGDFVGYRSSMQDKDFQHKGEVRSVHPDGIPSCKRPLVMLKGKAGVVLADHCTLLIPEGTT